MRVLKFIWSFPIEMIKSMFPQLNMDNTENKPRRRPLQTCGASAIEIVRKSGTRTQEFNGVIGSTAKLAFKFFGFILALLYSMLYTKWLAVSSFIDDYILFTEHLVELVFPPSKTIFDMIDDIVCGAEALPDKFDDLLTDIPDILHQFGFLDWICSYLISRNTVEKEIIVDVNHTEKAADHMQEDVNIAPVEEKPYSTNEAKDIHVEPLVANLSEVIHKSLKRLQTLENKRKSRKSIDGLSESARYSSFKSAVSSPTSDCSQDDHNSSFGKADDSKSSYKDVVTNGNKKIEGGKLKGKKDEIELKNQLLELFEESWHLM